MPTATKKEPPATFPSGSMFSDDNLDRARPQPGPRTRPDPALRADPRPRADLMPRAGFFHAWPEHEAALRQEFTRVYSCRQFVKGLSRTAQAGSHPLAAEG